MMMMMMMMMMIGKEKEGTQRILNVHDSSVGIALGYTLHDRGSRV
jgi:hypothetical protein